MSRLSRVRLFRKYNNIIFEMFAWGFTIKRIIIFTEIHIYIILLIFGFDEGLLLLLYT